MAFTNSYEDKTKADSYATLAFAGTYHLAFRDLPTLIRKHVTGTTALDFGCGTGRSTRFLTSLGFTTIGVDISNEMIDKAHTIDPDGTYLHIKEGDFHSLTDKTFDLIFSAFTFDNIPMTKKPGLFHALTTRMTANGLFINLVSSPDLYTHEWASFTTKEFPQNKAAKTGDIVRVITTDFPDRRPVDDILCADIDYQKLFTQARLQQIETLHPQATGQEPYHWKSETSVAPWTIYALKKKHQV